MLRYLLRRFVLMLIAMFIIASATWFLMQTLPGTPFQDEKLSETAREQLYAKYGLDDPLLVQYARYMGNLVQGELGNSFYYDSRPVLDIITDRLPVSAFLGAQALIFGIPVGLGLGIIAALRHNTLIDTSAVLVSVAGLSIPTLVLGPVLQYFVAVRAGLLPIAFFDSWQHSILPTLTLSGLVIAIVARYIRAEMLEVLGQDYVTMAKSKGLSRTAVTVKHVLKNALIPVITVIPPLAIGLLTGSLVVETVFAVPGIGEQFVAAIQVTDYYMIMGVTLFFALFFIISLLVQDLLYGVIDPRIRIAGGD